MNDLLVLVKLLSAIYQAKKLKDTNLIEELTDLLEELPAPNPDVMSQDRRVRDSIRSSISWLLDQSNDDPLIKSLLMQRVAIFCKNDDSLRDAVNVGLEDLETEELSRRLVYKQITEIRSSMEDEVFEKQFKKAMKEVLYKDLVDTKPEDFAKLIDLIQERVNNAYGERQSEVVSSVNTATPESMLDIIEMAKTENSAEGIIKTGIQGLNQGLEPDGGLRRSKMYLLEAMTNRGKSFGMAHLIASAGMYNKPMLRNKAKIPTILYESAEDAMELVIRRIYKLAVTTKYKEDRDFQVTESMDIVTAIADCFRKNGWYLVINQIEAHKDNRDKMFARVRQLELKGHEIILYGYDYLALQNFDKLPGENKSDKLQLLFRTVRSFMIARGICFLTPHQLSPEAKKLLKELDDESEVYFAREVSGKSMTETSTKITNEVDGVITIHVAKTSMKNYFTCSIGKQRGEGCSPEKRFFIYDLDPVLGLVHDINGKPAFRRSLQQRFNENGDVVKDWDAM
ncbi:TPA: DnaB family ATPase [Pseudomonas aeruginosa]|uniref:DnaB family ATPase n=1 Tax=Pseudomonas aeruginosa TaxID=287 RepID=UPI001BD6D817|nr:DnaB family ATPase [Pseudomonas aeruginosa]MBS9730348.1 hypothetical protein [Pseudomonas aeruginosa]UZV40008.1 DNA helicase [Pseudomonas phage IR-QUMS-PaBa1-GHS-2021]HDU8983389.1 hypothetical protein [Pseudomonas aeruginosa]